MKNNEMMSEIVKFASNNQSLEKVAQHYKFSERHISRLCKEKYGQNYTQLRRTIVFSKILEMILLEDKSQKEVAEIYFEGDEVQLRHFVKNIANHPLTQIKKGVGKMSKERIMALEAQTLSRLLNSKGNLTRKILNVPYSIINSLRKKGYDIISVPGRNGGYNLDVKSKQKCLNWINKIRENRFGLMGNYTF